MSSFVHAFHDRNEAGFPLLCDGCPGCEDLAGKGGLGLDGDRFGRAWEMMLAVEYRDEGRYLSAADQKLGRALYGMALLMEWNMGIYPWRWPVTPA